LADSAVGFSVSVGFGRGVRDPRLRALPRVVVLAGFGLGSGFASVSLGGSVSVTFSSVLASSVFSSAVCGSVAPTDDSRFVPRLAVPVSEGDSEFSATGIPPLNGWNDPPNVMRYWPGSSSGLRASTRRISI